MTTKSIKQQELSQTQLDWCEAEKNMRQRHKEELDALRKHYKKLEHDIAVAITFPRRK